MTTPEIKLVRQQQRFPTSLAPNLSETNELEEHYSFQPEDINKQFEQAFILNIFLIIGPDPSQNKNF